jgi:hypothetical protein
MRTKLAKNRSVTFHLKTLLSVCVLSCITKSKPAMCLYQSPINRVSLMFFPMIRNSQSAELISRANEVQRKII